MYKCTLDFDQASFNFLFWTPNISWYFLVFQNLLAPPPNHLDIQEELSFECSNYHSLSYLLVGVVTYY